MTELSNRSKTLAERAEVVCKHYLPNGNRVGRYWIVGDARNAEGGSMKVRLYPSKDGAVGRWVDYASGEYGDLLDVIRLSQGLANLRDTVREAEAFLSLPKATNNSSVSAIVGGALGCDMPSLRFHPRCFFTSGGELQHLPVIIAAFTNEKGDLTGLHRTFLDISGTGKVTIENP